MNKKTLYIIAGAAAAVLIAAIVLVLAFGGNGGRNYEKHYDAAEAAFLQQDYSTALKELDKAMEIDATEEAYLLKADVYYARGDIDMATRILLLGYSHVGGEAIPAMLERLKAETPGLSSGKPSEVTVGGVTLAPDATSAVLSGKGLGNADVQTLSALTQMEELTLSGNAISDISPLRDLGWLTSLQLQNNQISDLAPLVWLTSLKTLYIDGNPVEDFTPLEHLSALKTLSMKNIRITDKQLEALQKALPGCRIYADEPIVEVPEVTLGERSFPADVTELNLGGLELADITELAQCTALKKLDLRDNEITDLSPLAACTELEWLCLWNNQVEDLSPLAALENLRYLDIDTNAVTNVIALEGLTKMEELWLSNNELLNIEPLRGMTRLTRLGLKNVSLTDEAFDILESFTDLKELTIEENEGLSQEKFDALQALLPDCTIAHSELLAPEEPEEDERPLPDIESDEAFVSVGRDAALEAAGTGTGYAVIWDSTSSAASGFRDGFIAQSRTLGMNVVADLWYEDVAEQAASLAVDLQTLGADIVFVAAGDDALAALLAEADAIGYHPNFIQVL